MVLARPKLGDFSQEWQNARELQDADLAKKEERRDQARMEEKQETLGPALNPPPPPRPASPAPKDTCLLREYGEPVPGGLDQSAGEPCLQQKGIHRLLGFEPTSMSSCRRQKARPMRQRFRPKAAAGTRTAHSTVAAMGQQM